MHIFSRLACNVVFCLSFLLFLCTFSLLSSATEAGLAFENDPLFEGTSLVKGPRSVEVANQATICLPDRYYFIDKKDCAEVLGRMGSGAFGDELGIIFPADLSWVLVAYFDPIGYVPLASLGHVDWDAFFTTLQSNRAQTVHSTGARVDKWAQAPVVDIVKHRVTWSFSARNPLVGSASFSTYGAAFFGKEGVLTLVLSEDFSPRVLPQLAPIMDKVSFVPGKKYEDWQEGDSVSENGFQGVLQRSLIREGVSDIKQSPSSFFIGAAAVAATSGIALFCYLKKKHITM